MADKNTKSFILAIKLYLIIGYKTLHKLCRHLIEAQKRKNHKSYFKTFSQKEINSEAN